MPHAFAKTNSNSASINSTRGFLPACLILLVLAYLPAYADHIHHLWYNNATWQDEDLTALTGGGTPQSLSAMAAFRTTPNNQLHVYYINSADNHVQLYYDNHSWSDEDLTALTAGPNAWYSGITGFAIGNFQYVFYVSEPDNHMHELSYVDNWIDQDITGLVGGPSAVPLILAFPTKPNNQFHVYYVAQSTADFHQLYFNGSSWSDQDITSLIGRHVYCSGYMAGFAVGNLQHIFCSGTTTLFPSYEDVIHLYYNNSTWLAEDVSTKALGQPTHVQLYNMAAFKVPGINQFEVYTEGIDDDVHEFTHVVKPSLWTNYDLSAGIPAPQDAKAGKIVAFATTPNNQYHIYYAPSSEVYQLYYNGTAWSVEDLTGGVGNADLDGGMAGFAIGNLQHVFYMSNDRPTALCTRSAGAC